MSEMALLALNPLDGRYADKFAELQPVFSEYGLIKQRLALEIAWFAFLARDVALPELQSAIPHLAGLDQCLRDFNVAEAQKIKILESTTNHDVKAVEYYLKAYFETHHLEAHTSFIHFALTSEDINNLAYALMLKEGRDCLTKTLTQVIFALQEKARAYAALPMLCRTHGQPATPSTLGKELANFVARLQRQMKLFEQVSMLGKANGAVGNFNALAIAYPEINWPEKVAAFVTGLGLEFNCYTTQIEPHDFMSEYFQVLSRINTILVDLCRDVWGYISLNYFKQLVIQEEVGSSTMPHKVNPIYFENAEGNLGLANALAEFMSAKLPISRFQRDLTDSTVLRNIGIIVGYSLLAYTSLLTGLNRIVANEAVIIANLKAHPEVLAEAIQTVLRRYGVKDAYERLKALSRGTEVDFATQMKTLLDEVDIPTRAKAQLSALTVTDYIGYAKELASSVKDLV